MKLDGRGITVYCSSSDAAPEAYVRVARELGTVLAQAGATVVYGGASVGLMGAVANAALAAGGRVVGVIPQRLMDRELGHTGLTELHVVATMHERKAIMAERASGYVVLPGGFGTWEECFGVITWKQLGMHTKPIVLVNVDGFYDATVAQMRRAVADHVIRPEHTELVCTATTVPEVLARLTDAPAETPAAANWI